MRRSTSATCRRCSPSWPRPPPPPPQRASGTTRRQGPAQPLALLCPVLRHPGEAPLCTSLAPQVIQRARGVTAFRPMIRINLVIEHMHTRNFYLISLSPTIAYLRMVLGQINDLIP